MTKDDELIRRGDALKALDWGDIYGRNAQAAIEALPAAPSVQQAGTPPEVLALVEAAGGLADIISQAFPALARDPHVLNVRATLAEIKGESHD